jgi:hypothetical protein
MPELMPEHETFDFYQCSSASCSSSLARLLRSSGCDRCDPSSSFRRRATGANTAIQGYEQDFDSIRINVTALT